MGQHKLQAAVLVYVREIVPRTSALCLWYHGTDQGHDF